MSNDELWARATDDVRREYTRRNQFGDVTGQSVADTGGPEFWDDVEQRVAELRLGVGDEPG